MFCLEKHGETSWGKWFQDGSTSRGGTTAGVSGTELLRNGQTTLNGFSEKMSVKHLVACRPQDWRKLGSFDVAISTGSNGISAQVRGSGETFRQRIDSIRNILHPWNRKLPFRRKNRHMGGRSGRLVWVLAVLVRGGSGGPKFRAFFVERTPNVCVVRTFFNDENAQRLPPLNRRPWKLEKTKNKTKRGLGEEKKSAKIWRSEVGEGPGPGRVRGKGQGSRKGLS